MKNVLELLERACKNSPDKVFLQDSETEITYRDFINRSKSVASALKEFGKACLPVAVYMNKTPDNAVGFFGSVYAGKFYTVIDPEMPKDRMMSILNTLEPCAIICDRAHKDTLDSIETWIKYFVYEDIVNTEIDEEFIESVREKSIDTDPLYVLFTSGSTGVPKGTVVNHRSVLAYSRWVCDTFDINENTVFGNQTPFYFSMSVLDLFSTMRAGATLDIIPKVYFTFPIKLAEYVNNKKINTIYWVPSALCVVANLKLLDYVKFESLNKILFAGEVMPTKQLNYWIAHMEGAYFANLYGPTEVTDICTYYEVDRKFADDESLPIGKHCNNCGVFLLKDDNTEAKNGEVGELCVRGSFLASGYYNNPEKTNEVFVQNPLNTHYPELIYKTGDLVRVNELGEYIYVGRKDFQIKHMGYRIELGEIETAISAVEKLNSCVCVFDMQADKIVLIYEGRLSENDILASIKDKLPKYMYPDIYIKVKSMPHNANGKIDRAWLKNNYKTL